MSALILPPPLLPDHAQFLLSRRADFQSALLTWFAAHQRALPWRDRPSLYKTVVSEFMLQQTQVKTVLPYFARWLATFPDFTALAAASEEQVLKQWEGLGYYSRARNLHRLAKAVVALPAVPRKPAEWRELPGVGPYTAAAITSIAFGEPAACVDGNVVRILARLTGDDTAFRDSTSAAKAYTAIAEELVTRNAPGDHNQAMMELGATVCLRSSPLCTVCPVFELCAGRKSGDPERFPRLAAKAMERVAITRIWWIHEGCLLLHRADAKARRLANLHELPTAADLGLGDETLRDARPLATKKRGITRYQITETILAIAGDAALRKTLSRNAQLHWVPVNALDQITLSGPHRRWAAEILADLTPPNGRRAAARAAR